MAPRKRPTTSTKKSPTTIGAPKSPTTGVKKSPTMQIQPLQQEQPVATHVQHQPHNGAPTRPIEQHTPPQNPSTRGRQHTREEDDNTNAEAEPLAPQAPTTPPTTPGYSIITPELIEALQFIISQAAEQERAQATHLENIAGSYQFGCSSSNQRSPWSKQRTNRQRQMEHSRTSPFCRLLQPHTVKPRNHTIQETTDFSGIR
jgi:hypothetical protein